LKRQKLMKLRQSPAKKATLELLALQAPLGPLSIWKRQKLTNL
jgi:hypothetical protein